MSTIGTNSEDLILNADGSGSDIKFKSNGVEKASISDAGLFTSTTIDATKLTGALPAISGAALTGVGVAGITSSADATAITINSSEQVGIGTGSPTSPLHVLASSAGQTVAKFESNQAGAVAVEIDADADRDSFLRFQEAGTNRWDFFAQGSSGTNELNIRNQSGTNVIRMTQNGHVTMPSQPAFYAYGGSSQNSDSKYTVEFTNTATNVGSHYNTSTYRFTAPVAGTYFFSYGWMISTENNRHHIAKNGTAVGENQYSPSTGYARVEGSAVITCAVNDYIEVKNNAASNPLESAMHGSYRYFVGHLIG